jgi:hypothetical protein
MVGTPDRLVGSTPCNAGVWRVEQKRTGESGSCGTPTQVFWGLRFAIREMLLLLGRIDASHGRS